MSDTNGMHGLTKEDSGTRRRKNQRSRLRWTFSVIVIALFIRTLWQATLEVIRTNEWMSQEQEAELRVQLSGPKSHPDGVTTRESLSTFQMTNASSFSRRPTFILHVGPPKTATTFLQCSLCANHNVSDPILLEDNWVFLGTCPYRTCGLTSFPSQFLPHMRGSFFWSGSLGETDNLYGAVPHEQPVADHIKKYKRQQIDLTFHGKVMKLHEEGRNVLVVFEGLHNIEFEMIRALYNLLTPHWNVHVLIAYRPLYQWLPSKYNSVRKPSHTGAVRRWPGLPSDRKPGVISTHTLPFDPENSDPKFATLVETITRFQQHPAETVLHNFEFHFSNVTVIPMHRLGTSKSSTGIKVDPMLEKLVCGIMNASQSCAAIHQGLIGTNVSSNPSVSLNYDRLAVAAWEAQLVGSTHRRSKVRNAVEKHQLSLNRTGDDFPLLCLSDDKLDRFERLSWALEAKLFNATPEWEEAHKAGFKKSRTSTSAFCSIDTNRTLQDPDWRSFFASLTVRRRDAEMRTNDDDA